jgi:hypothetical protein
MRHFLLTRSAYSPALPPEMNRRRLRITGHVTIPSVRAQAEGFTWLVVVHPQDPMLDERIGLFSVAGARFAMCHQDPAAQGLDGDDPAVLLRRLRTQQTWATEGLDNMLRSSGVWAEHLPAGPLLTTILDDDDAITPDYLGRMRAAATGDAAHLVIPRGFYVCQATYLPKRHPKNMTASVWSPDGSLHAHSVGHGRLPLLLPTRIVDEEPGWLWVRHEDTISVGRQTGETIPDWLRALFPIDWEYVENL